MQHNTTTTTNSESAVSAPRVRKVVIPIAGYGTRMFPASKCIPKALLPMFDHRDGICKPVLQIILEEAMTALKDEDCEFCVVLSPSQRELIEDYFRVPEKLEENDAEFGAYIKKEDCKKQLEKIQYIGKRLTFIEQREQKGFGHAVLFAKEFVGNEPFLVMLGDHVYTSSHEQRLTCVQQLVYAYQFYSEQQPAFMSATTLTTCPVSELHLNGIIKSGKALTAHQQHHQGTSTTASSATSMELLPSSYLHSVTCMQLDTCIEKPSYQEAKEKGLILSEEDLKKLYPNTSFKEERAMCYLGIDLMSPKIFDILEQNEKENKLTKGELQLRDGQLELMKMENGGMLGVFAQGDRHDTGIPTAYATTFVTMKDAMK